MNFAKEIKQLPSLWKQSSQNLRSVRAITGCALFTALNIILTAVRIDLTPMLSIGFSSLAVAVSGFYYGPILTGLAGIIVDNLGYIIHPNGPYFPFFAINAFLTGFIYGSFFYKQETVSLKRVILARICITVLINLILTPIWLHMMYGNAIFAVPRIIKNIVMLPIDIWLLYIVLKTAKRIRPKI